VEVRVQPENLQIQTGQSGEFAVEVVDVQGLYAFDVALNFDPDVLQVQDADPGIDGVQVGFGTFLEPGFVLLNNVDNDQGTLRFAMTQLNPAPPVDGSGILIVVKLRGVKTDASVPIRFENVQLATNQGTEIAATPVDGEIEVVDTLQGPTSTPFPTRALGTLQPSRTPAAPTPTRTIGPSPTAAAVVPTNTAALPTATGVSASEPDQPAPNPTETAFAQATAPEISPTATGTSQVVSENQQKRSTPTEPKTQGSIPKDRQATSVEISGVEQPTQEFQETPTLDNTSSNWLLFGGIGLITVLVVLGLLVFGLAILLFANTKGEQPEEGNQVEDE